MAAPNLMQAGAQMLAAAMKAAAGVAVLYYRQTSPGSEWQKWPLTCWLGRQQEFSTTPANAQGATAASTDVDFLCAVADFPARLHEPREGDRVKVTMNGEQLTFELRGGQGQPAWSYSDRQRTIYRLRGKLLKERKVPA